MLGITSGRPSLAIGSEDWYSLDASIFRRSGADTALLQTTILKTIANQYLGIDM